MSVNSVQCIVSATFYELGGDYRKRCASGAIRVDGKATKTN
jgi:hypothetical protein